MELHLKFSSKKDFDINVLGNNDSSANGFLTNTYFIFQLFEDVHTTDMMIHLCLLNQCQSYLCSPVAWFVELLCSKKHHRTNRIYIHLLSSNWPFWGCERLWNYLYLDWSAQSGNFTFNTLLEAFTSIFESPLNHDREELNLGSQINSSRGRFLQNLLAFQCLKL